MYLFFHSALQQIEENKLIPTIRYTSGDIGSLIMEHAINWTRLDVLRITLSLSKLREGSSWVEYRQRFTIDRQV